MVKDFEFGMLMIGRNLGAGLRAIGNNLKSYWKRFVEWHRKFEDGLAVKCEGCPMEMWDVIWCGIANYHPRVAKCFEENRNEG